MKAKKAMKSTMKRRAMKVSKIGKRRSVFNGTKAKTQGGLTKSSFKKNKRGRIVSVKASNRAKNSKSARIIGAWGKAVKQARQQLKIKGFCPVGGKTAQGKQLLARVRSLVK